MRGRSLTGNTFSVNEVLVLRAPSLTVNVIVLAPNASSAGATDTVRPPLVPFTTIPPGGTSAEFDELATTVRLPAPVSASATVNESGGVTPSSLIVQSSPGEISGASAT